MSVQKNLEILETILARRRGYSTSSEQLAYDRGYLMAILARLASEDSFVRAALHRLLEKKR
jgi:hypothetical protein